MKLFLFFLLSWGCTQKYADYHLIRKVDFDKESYRPPVTTIQVMAQGKDELKQCFNQWLFFSNAEKQKDRHIPDMVRVLCPGKDFLVNATFTERWWTTILFTQSCVHIATTCGTLRSRQ
jgi:hypothetical protein